MTQSHPCDGDTGTREVAPLPSVRAGGEWQADAVCGALGARGPVPWGPAPCRPLQKAGRLWEAGGTGQDWAPARGASGRGAWWEHWPPSTRFSRCGGYPAGARQTRGLCEQQGGAPTPATGETPEGRPGWGQWAGLGRAVLCLMSGLPLVPIEDAREGLTVPSHAGAAGLAPQGPLAVPSGGLSGTMPIMSTWLCLVLAGVLRAASGLGCVVRPLGKRPHMGSCAPPAPLAPPAPRALTPAWPVGLCLLDASRVPPVPSTTCSRAWAGGPRPPSSAPRFAGPPRRGQAPRAGRGRGRGR